MINEALHLNVEWLRAGGASGLQARVTALPKLPADASVPQVEIFSEIDLIAPQGKDLATNRIPVPTAGKVLVGVTLGRAMFGLDPSTLPPIKDHQLPVAFWFMRKIADSSRGTRDLGYVHDAALHSLGRFQLQDAVTTALRTLNNTILINIAQFIPIPVYQSTKETELLMGFIAVWNTRDTKPLGV